MPEELLTTDIRGQMILLGTGTSVGVPVIGCGCDVCRSDNPRKRTRCSAILGLPGGNLLIDTSPDLREQLLREQIGIVHAVLYTHEHADHIFGLDDLRLMQFYLGGPVPLYCEPAVEERIRKSFDYAFQPTRRLHPGRRAAAGVSPDRPRAVRGARRAGHADSTEARQAVRRARLSHRQRGLLHRRERDSAGEHGAAARASTCWCSTHCGRAATRRTSAWRRRSKSPAQLAPRQTYFTHMSHELEHEATNAALPPGMALAYDGLRIALT